ncbi:MAG: adenylosuccinate synthase [Bacteroidetes bacterium]|nr:MAG: adenylosuccinate synthase [Bacteroidota bacterium]
MKVDVLLGLQWGDEGKGKIVDVLTPKYDIIARFQGGPNAGHTLIMNGNKHVLHIIPSGIFHAEKMNLIGNGVIIDPLILRKEIEQLRAKNIDPKHNLLISKKAHLILPSHRLLDAVYEKNKGDKKIGSTLKGIGPTYTDKVARLGVRVKDILSEDFTNRYHHLKDIHLSIANSYQFDVEHFELDKMPFSEYEQQWLEAVEYLKDFQIINSEEYLNRQIDAGKRVLAEGAQGTLLDVDFGSYPFVTSSNTISAGVCLGLGIAPQRIGRVFGIVKSYCTRVGSGPFPTELFDENGKKLQDEGHEYGATTGRPRRCGWLDMCALKYAIMLNGVTDLIMTKADVLNAFPSFKACEAYQDVNGNRLNDLQIEDEGTRPIYKEFEGWSQEIAQVSSKEELPQHLKTYIEYVEKETDVNISILSIGPDRSQTLIFDASLK